jgi:hypothetical protein
MNHALNQNSFRQEIFCSTARNYFRIALLLFFYLFVIVLYACSAHSLVRSAAPAGGNNSYVSSLPGKEKFTLAAAGRVAPLWISAGDYPGVLRSLKNLQTDINAVTGIRPELIIDTVPAGTEIVIAGTLGKSPVLDKLVQDKKLDVVGITGKWETFLIQVIEKPLPGVDKALVIAGSDKRGTIFGIYDLAAKIGVSPWAWWADVPVRKQSSLYVNPDRYTAGEPAVKYRGIFINDEAPNLSGLVLEKFGGFNSKFYEHVFELILRLKGNYLWPAMWGRAFYVDDPLNPKLADEMGVVIGTSHHEPCMRAHAEWAKFGSGPWNYEKNKKVLQEFWGYGIERMNGYESIVTIGMRGDGDEPMSEGANISLLERIVSDQRQIISKQTGKDVTTIPQIWALYKEVQEYYDKGMRVPDDVTLLLCDDNWGNIRKLPRLTDAPRTGGYGIYYHYDYVGGPRNYKWVNTNQISRVWEQMHLAYESGVKQIWIVNVGDIKPMEFPIEFFLDYAWNPKQWPAERLPEYTRLWAERQFGTKYARDIADILTEYTRYNSRRKPELLSADTYSLINYSEAETIVAAYKKLARKAQELYDTLPVEYEDAFYQLVLHPVAACANLNDLYLSVAKNHLYADQGRACTNLYAARVKELFRRDTTISYYYNKIMAKGKWNHMMDQTHIGYTYWQQPETNVMPEVKEIDVPATAEMGVAIEGSIKWWPLEKSAAVLPEFDPYTWPGHYLEIFNRGETDFQYSVQAGESWLQVNPQQGSVGWEQRLWVNIEWSRVPVGKHRVPIIITGPNQNQVIVYAVINNPALAQSDLENRFVESNGYISIEAEHFSRVVNTDPISWQKIPDLGRTLSAMTPFPVTAPVQSPEGDSPRLEYLVYLFNTGEIKVQAFLSPTLNFHNNQGLRYGISFDSEPAQIINMHANKTFQDWEASVSNNITIEVSRHNIKEPGQHVLKFWAVDPGVVLQKLVIETAEIKPSYLGPPESYKGARKANQ